MEDAPFDRDQQRTLTVAFIKGLLDDDHKVPSLARAATGIGEGFDTYANNITVVLAMSIGLVSLLADNPTDEEVDKLLIKNALQVGHLVILAHKASAKGRDSDSPFNHDELPRLDYAASLLVSYCVQVAMYAITKISEQIEPTNYNPEKDKILPEEN